MELRFLPINVFRETPKVMFFDAGINLIKNKIQHVFDGWFDTLSIKKTNR